MIGSETPREQSDALFLKGMRLMTQDSFKSLFSSHPDLQPDMVVQKYLPTGKNT